MTPQVTPSKYLFAVALGPVQDFIAVARRSRDLWFGSWLLSELSKTAARIVQSGDDELIFPAPSKPDDLNPESEFDAPNKILAVINRAPAEVGLEMYKAVQARLMEIANRAFDVIGAAHFDDATRHTAELQVKDLVEFYWAAVPHVNGDEYAGNRRAVEHLLAARKNTREFAAISWGVPGVYKSSLDGQREAVIPQKGFRRAGDEKAVYDTYGLRVGERLCGVGVLKRHGTSETAQRFISTSHAAAMPTLERFKLTKEKEDSQAVPPIEGQSLTNKLNAYIEALKGCGVKESELKTSSIAHPFFKNYDGHILFSERLVDFLDEREQGEQLETARGALKDFLCAVNKGRSPHPYYALLHGDGDYMGKAIDHQSTIDQHRLISQQLTRFASRVREIVPDHDGVVVYAGGDDVFAFLPVHKAVACARELAGEFKVLLQKFGFTDDDGTPRQPSLSVGILIAHHLEPLTDALDLVRAAEKHAKSVKDKNALAVTISKRSGADRTVKGHWKEIDERLQMFAEWHGEGEVPDGAAYQLRDLHLRLSTEDGDVDSSVLREAGVFEARRILQRKRNESNEGIDPERLKLLDDWLKSGELSLRELADELIVARELARASRAARVEDSDSVIDPAANN